MTPKQAGQIKALAVATTAQRAASTDAIDVAAAEELETATLRLLLPLPYERTLSRVREYVATHTWCSSLSELLDACDVPERVRGDLFRAAEDGHEFWPSLRGKGWEVVPKGEALPRGVGEWLTNLGLPIPEGRTVDVALAAMMVTNALPAAKNGPPPEIGDAIRALSARFQTGARALVAVQEKRTPEIPAELQPAYEKLQQAMRSVETAKKSHADAADEYRRRIAELVEDASPSDLPMEAVKPAAVRLLRRLVEDGGAVAAAEAIGEVWGLEVREFETAPKDRFEDEPPQRVRVVLATGTGR